MIIGFTPISNHFQTSKHVIKARDSRLALVDVVIEGFIGKPPLEGTQAVELPTFKDPKPVELPAFENPKPIIEEITSSNEEAKTETEDHTLEGDTEIPIRDEDFEIFSPTNTSKEEKLNSQLTTALVSEDQEGNEVPEWMVIEKKLPNLLSLLESHARTVAPEVPVVPRPPTPIPPTRVQTEPTDKKGKRDKKGGKGVVEEGEVQEETPPKPTKVAKMTRTQQGKGVESSSTASEQRSQVPN